MSGSLLGLFPRRGGSPAQSHPPRWWWPCGGSPFGARSPKAPGGFSARPGGSPSPRSSGGERHGEEQQRCPPRTCPVAPSPGARSRLTDVLLGALFSYLPGFIQQRFFDSTLYRNVLFAVLLLFFLIYFAFFGELARAFHIWSSNVLSSALWLRLPLSARHRGSFPAKRAHQAGTNTAAEQNHLS